MKALLFIVIFNFLIFPQSEKAEKILQRLVKNFDRVQDYEVDVKIDVNISRIKVPETNAKLFFKQPDKVSMKSDGFAIIPKSGFNFSPSTYLKGDYTALYDRKVKLDGDELTVIKVIPIGDHGDVILSTLWIDEQADRIRKIESTTKTNGTFEIVLSYNDGMKYPLPSKIVFSFNMDKLNLPINQTDEKKSDKKSNGRQSSLTKGEVAVIYSNYKINKGISDSVFEEKSKQ